MLQWLAYLLCPLMMLVCMGGLVRPGKRSADEGSSSLRARSRSSSSRAEELAQLRAEQEDLARRIELLEAQPEKQEIGARPRRAAG